MALFLPSLSTMLRNVVLFKKDKCSRSRIIAAAVDLNTEYVTNNINHKSAMKKNKYINKESMFLHCKRTVVNKLEYQLKRFSKFN